MLTDCVITGAGLVKLKPSNCDWSIVASKCLLPSGVSLASSRVNSESKLLVSGPGFCKYNNNKRFTARIYVTG